MDTFPAYMAEYKIQLQNGVIQKAYQGLMEYILGLRTYLKSKYPAYSVSGSLYYGYMDMTYFAFIPESLKQRNLKVAVVFLHETCRFEAWLAGVNKQVQSKYWQMINEIGWDRYRLVPSTQGADAILEHVLVEDPDFSDLDGLTRRVEVETMRFISDVESFLLQHPD